MALDDRLRDDAKELGPQLVELRHRLHQYPELGLDLPVTQQTVLAELAGLGLEVGTGTGLSSVTAVLRGTGSGPAVLLRGDMDALPVGEDTGLDFASKVDGAMHACGHDLHTAMLVGAARLLAAHRDALAGDVVFMFQPGEEGWDGAAHSMHVMSAELPQGVFGTRPGTLMAGSNVLRVCVHGSGGHGSMPHLARDPITAAAEMVTALQTMVTRRFYIFDPVVVTVGMFHAGTKRNIIPDDARFEATVRTFSPEANDRIRDECRRLCERIADAHGVEAEVEFETEYPVTVNDDQHAAFAADVITDVFGDDRYVPLPDPVSGSEDFSRVLDSVPGAYLFLGAHSSDNLHGPMNHSPRAVFDDAVLTDGVLLHAQLAVRALRRDAVAQ